MIVLMTLGFVLVERDFIFSSFSRTIKSAKFRIIPKMNIDIKIKGIGVIKKKSNKNNQTVNIIFNHDITVVETMH